MTKRTAKLATEAEAPPGEEPAIVENISPIKESGEISAPPSILNVRHCSACGGDHDGVVEFPLTEPALDIRGVPANHYFTCPATGTTVYVVHQEA